MISLKKLILLIFIFMILMPGCTREAALPVDNSGKISIVTTKFAVYDFAREIAGGNADITLLIPPGSESHSYELTPQDTVKIQNCNLFAYVGGVSDMWVDKTLNSMDTGKMRIVTLTDCIALVREEIVEGMEDDDDDDIPYDEHIWTSPANAKLIVQKLSDAICAADKENADLYIQNTAAYIEKLDDLDVAFKAVIGDANRRTIVFGDRFPFRYFSDAYGLRYFAAFSGCSSDTEPSAKTVAFLIDKVKDEHIPVVFHIELSSERIADTICEATGAKKMLLHSCHNISKADFNKGVSYLELMIKNAAALKEALT